MKKVESEPTFNDAIAIVEFRQRKTKSRAIIVSSAFSVFVPVDVPLTQSIRKDAQEFIDILLNIFP